MKALALFHILLWCLTGVLGLFTLVFWPLLVLLVPVAVFASIISLILGIAVLAEPRSNYR